MKNSIIALLAEHGPLNAVAIAAHLGVPERSARKRLQEMAVTEQTLVRHVSYGSHKYSLAAKDNRRWYPWSAASEYLQAAPSGSSPEDVRRLMAEV